MKFIDSRVDFAFRKIFGSEETKEVLKSFIEAVLDLEGDKKLKEIHIANPYQLPKLQLLKITILDVKCTEIDGAIEDINLSVGIGLGIANADKFPEWNKSAVYKRIY